MKHLKTYKSRDGVTCNECGWSWEIEKDDDRKYLCHKCGYDSELKKFDMKSLNDWKTKNSDTTLPFSETKISDNTYIREFRQDTDSNEYVWHRDREDRTIESIGETDWMVQMDNELPKRIDGTLEIPMGIYHRLIKGSGDLKIRLTKIPK